MGWVDGVVMCRFHFFADAAFHACLFADSYFLPMPILAVANSRSYVLIILINIKLITLRYENESYYII